MAGVVKTRLFSHDLELKPLPEQGRCVTEAITFFKFGESGMVYLPKDMTEPAFTQCTGIRSFPKGNLPAVLEKIKCGNQFLIKLERNFR